MINNILSFEVPDVEIAHSMKKPILLLLTTVLFFAGGCTPQVPESHELANEAPAKPVKAAATRPKADARSQQFHFDQQILAEAEKKYGASARQRLHEWEKLIRTDNSRTDMEKLRKVNSFFNQFTFIDDETHWGQQDYWATPIEFLASGGGDCEDFSLAKYFTLKAMGVNVRRLYLTYVKNLNIDDYHMVMTYFEVPGINPLILDNLTDEIQPAAQRTDLLPVYSFNDTGLWMAQTPSQGRLVGKSDELNHWKELLTRMPEWLK